MSQYRPTAQQVSLLQLPFQTSTLCSWASQPVWKIQIVSLKGVKALKSRDDNQRKIRIVLASIIIKILLQHSQKNEQRLQTLKKIVYAAKLQQITQKKGILREHLLKSVAQKFSRLLVGPDAEMEVLKMFNLTPFFDEVILDALKQENPLMFESDCQLIAWLDRQLDFKIIITEDSLSLENESELFLLGMGERFHPTKDCKSIDCTCKEYRQFLRQSTQSMADFKEEPENIYDRKSRGEMFSRLIFQEEQMDKMSNSVNPNLYTSVLSSSMELGASRNLLTLKAPPQMKMTEVSGSLNSPTFYRNNKTDYEDKTDNQIDTETEKEHKVIKVKRKKADNEQGGLWSILCCKF